jgi:hypothetical protein
MKNDCIALKKSHSLIATKYLNLKNFMVITFNKDTPGIITKL